MLVSDCHFFNFGLRLTTDPWVHEIVLIDAGSRPVSPVRRTKREVNGGMRKLWKWARSESETNPDEVRTLWQQEHCLVRAVELLEDAWRQNPRITIHPCAPTRLDTALGYNLIQRLQQHAATAVGEASLRGPRPYRRSETTARTETTAASCSSAQLLEELVEV